MFKLQQSLRQILIVGKICIFLHTRRNRKHELQTVLITVLNHCKLVSKYNIHLPKIFKDHLSFV